MDIGEEYYAEERGRLLLSAGVNWKHDPRTCDQHVALVEYMGMNQKHWNDVLPESYAGRRKLEHRKRCFILTRVVKSA